MDNQILVNKLHNYISKQSKRNKHFNLAMLLDDDPARFDSHYSLLVSSKWLDNKSPRQAVSEIMQDIIQEVGINSLFPFFIVSPFLFTFGTRLFRMKFLNPFRLDIELHSFLPEVRQSLCRAGGILNAGRQLFASDEDHLPPHAIYTEHLKTLGASLEVQNHFSDEAQCASFKSCHTSPSPRGVALELCLFIRVDRAGFRAGPTSWLGNALGQRSISLRLGVFKNSG